MLPTSLDVSLIPVNSITQITDACALKVGVLLDPDSLPMLYNCYHNTCLLPTATISKQHTTDSTGTYPAG
jgi:hypothetical protein